MNLVKWNPFNELEDVSNRLNSLFGRLPARTESGQLALADWTPSVDISETDAAYLIKAEIPEVGKENVKVTLQNGMLTIAGERKQEKEEKTRNSTVSSVLSAALHAASGCRRMPIQPR